MLPISTLGGAYRYQCWIFKKNRFFWETIEKGTLFYNISIQAEYKTRSQDIKPIAVFLRKGLFSGVINPKKLPEL